MPSRLSQQEVAQRLRQSPAFVERMIAKGRLHPDAESRMSAKEVEQLAALLDRLRQGGVATVLGAIEEQLQP